MDQNLKQVSKHMRGLGLGALQHANWHANYSSIDNEWWNELSVIQAAHAAEILIKARIAEEHPLLIFESLPKNDNTGSELSFRAVAERARTIQFQDLPDRLWAATGIVLQSIEIYKSFGRLRNSVQHFYPPHDVDTGYEALKFIFEVIDPFINKCWGLYAIDFNEDHERFQYFVEGLVERKIRFLVSPDCAEEIDIESLEWPEDDEAYQTDMLKRFHVAATKNLQTKPKEKGGKSGK